MIENWIELEIVNADNGQVLYAGNIDEVVSVSLAGQGNGRYGYEQGVRNFHNFGLEDLTIDMFTHFNDEYGSSVYCLGETNTNYLRLKLDEYTDPYHDDIFLEWVRKIKTLTIPYEVGYGDDIKTLNMRINRVFLDRRIVSIVSKEVKEI